jgi:hypothetical protein
MVAADNEVDMGEVERWSTAEGKANAFNEIRRIFLPPD